MQSSGSHMTEQRAIRLAISEFRRALKGETEELDADTRAELTAILEALRRKRDGVPTDASYARNDRQVPLQAAE